jgi:hypothetical protein
MRTSSQSSSSVSRPTPPNAFTPEYLEEVQGQNEPLTAAESDFAGPWKIDPVPGRPGLVAVLRQWEDLEAGDVPFATFWHEEQARRCAAILHAVGREPLFSLGDEPEPEGFPLLQIYGEQGPQVAGWLTRSHTEVLIALHHAEVLARRPADLAEIAATAGGGALHQIGRILAQRT